MTEVNTMKAYQLPGILMWVSAVALTGWVGTATAGGIPQKSYACHVTTSTTIPAVALVQANDANEAAVVALRNKAVTFDGVRVKPAAVVQCILSPGEKFNDATFQQNYDKMGR
jgi:hypothetical protein